MPSRLSNGASTAMTPSRFELPALDFNFGRITDGTNIPPPPPSPKVPTPPQTPPADKKEPAPDAVRGEEDDGAISTPPNDAKGMPLGNTSMVNGGRPDSRGTTNVDDKWSKRSSGWFRRLRGADAKRSSFYFEEAAPVTAPAKKSLEQSQKPAEPPQKPAGPPAPKIPEIVSLENDAGSLGSDLFKNIN